MPAPRQPSALAWSSPAPINLSLFAGHSLWVQHWESGRESRGPPSNALQPQPCAPEQRTSASGRRGCSGQKSHRRARGWRGQDGQRTPGGGGVEGRWGRMSRPGWGQEDQGVQARQPSPGSRLPQTSEDRSDNVCISKHPSSWSEPSQKQKIGRAHV